MADLPVGLNNLILYDEKGLPYPARGVARSREVLLGTMQAMLALPYTPNINPADLQGLSMWELGCYRLARLYAQGDMEAIKLVQDRVLGKAKAVLEVNSTSGTYKELLELIRAKEAEAIVDVEVYGPSDTTFDIESIM